MVFPLDLYDIVKLFISNTLENEKIMESQSKVFFLQSKKCHTQQVLIFNINLIYIAL